MRIRGSIIRSCSLSLLKAIISTLTDAKVGSGQKPVNPDRLPLRPRSLSRRPLPGGSTAPGVGGVVGIRLFCGYTSGPPGPAVGKAARAAWPPPDPPARPLPRRLGLRIPPEGGGSQPLGRAVSSRAGPPAVLPRRPLLLGYLQMKLAALQGPRRPPACLLPHMPPRTKECPAGLP